MVDFYLGQIFQGGWNFAPKGSALCAGQTLSIAQNTALFALLGTSFGGNGQTTFQLPDLQGRVMAGTGNGLGLQPYILGEVGGNAQVSLTTQNLPQHTHTFSASTNKATTQIPANSSMLAHSDDTSGKGSTPAIYIPSNTSTASVNLAGVGMTGNSLPFSILNPFLAITICIALVGVFPTRN